MLSRFLVVSVLAVLLLSPFIRTRETTTFKPIVAVVQDNSESIRSSFSSQDSAAYFTKLQRIIDKLSSRYEVVTYTAGDQLTKSSLYPLTDKVTNLSGAIDDLNDLYYNRNLGAVIIASDGIYNQGINPIYSAAKAPYNIYSIALGDTTIPRDLKISNAYYNKITYLNDQFALRVDVESTHLAGSTASLTISEVVGAQTKAISSQPVIVSADQYIHSHDFVIPARQVGVVHYRLALTYLTGEVTYLNNAKDIYVEVLDGRQKILLLANSPHPDAAALKAAVESNKNYQLDVAYAPDAVAKLNDYNLIILHQLPSTTNKVTTILQQAKELKKPILFVMGSQTVPNDLNAVQNALHVTGNINRYSDVTARVNRDFSRFTLTDATQQALTKFPPLENFFGEYKAGANAQSLLLQKINNVETDYPLWLFDEGVDSKVGVIAGEGIWRWKLYDYLQNKNTDAFNEIVDKTIQYLAVKADKRPFRVNLSKNIFQDNESITLDAQLYNASYELVNTPDVDLKVRSDEGKEYPFKFNKTDNYYSLNAGFLPVGSYSFSAGVKLGNQVYKSEGRFSIAPLQLEQIRTVADHRVMYQLASQHHGQLYYPSTMEQLVDELLAKDKLKSVLYDSYITESAIHLRWIFALLLLLLSMEWFIRKYFGGY
jgi:hypothetical protein